MSFNKLPVTNWDADDEKRIKKLFNLKHGDCWTKTSLSSVRKKLRKELLASQKYLCAYCRRKISLEVGMNEIDHIVRKSTDETIRFTYHRVNLVATCKRCNNNKNDYNVLNLSINNSQPYPMAQNDYNWVHPYIHDYYSHIEISEGMFFSHVVNGKNSPEGAKVIKICKLDKLHTIEKRKMAEKINSETEPKTALLILMGNYPEASAFLLAQRAFKHFKRKGWNWSIERIRNYIQLVRDL